MSSFRSASGSEPIGSRKLALLLFYKYENKPDLKAGLIFTPKDVFYFGGDEGNRTPVRKLLTKAFYEYSY